jgi:hypothetical protein
MDLATRAKNILITPKSEWRVIAGETAEIGSLYKSYVLPMAAIPPVCSFIGLSVFGIAGFRMGIGSGLAMAIVHYVLTLVGVYVAALIASKLAPTFGGRDDLVQALKLIAFSATASWVGGIFGLIPLLGILSLLMSLYGLYLLFAGAAIVMSIPEERAVGYGVAVIVCTAAVFLILFYLAGSIVGRGMMM